MIQIYGPAGSSAGRCHWALEEIGIPYEAIPVNMKNQEHKTPEFLRMNPNGKVPVMKDGDFVLWESMAINFYLAEKYKPALLGADLQEKADVLKWSFWALVEYQKPIIDAFIQKVFVPEAHRDHALITRSLEKILPLNDILDRHLQRRTYMVGTSFTLGDINVASVARLCSMIGADVAKFPALQSWVNRMVERPAALKASAIDKH
ncbi:MAG TPA: glutathione S-transferase family protein [Oligoflexus sp.]|uniref:glutathione S-transferase family protein n=1 Tax=Oligoflexus sp. TaxID=1971216 RepID=UPI002D4F5B55|nr:glutathione S-transferase family protein [Oligoflexus sp.]HYX33796.1 glutathione S-transferase family protein [Oligoflexus sp.]